MGKMDAGPCNKKPHGAVAGEADCHHRALRALSIEDIVSLLLTALAQ